LNYVLGNSQCLKRAQACLGYSLHISNESANFISSANNMFICQTHSQTESWLVFNMILGLNKIEVKRQHTSTSLCYVLKEIL